MRQTNAVWIMFVVGILMLEELSLLGKYKEDSMHISSIISFIVGLWDEKFHLIKVAMPLLIPVGAFALFVVKNGGIVLGKKIYFIFCINNPFDTNH